MSRPGQTQSPPRVAVIGAGFGGIAAAIKLRQAGAHVDLFERADRVGGVWRENTYPGSECDVPSFLYSYSFAPKHDWSRAFAGQAEILDYIETVVARSGIDSSIHLGHELVAAEFDEDSMVWRLQFSSGAVHEADFVVAACGQMSSPNIPVYDGESDFGGSRFHTAEWDHSVPLDGKDVVVVGTGASVIQVVPAIADRARTVTVVQRSPGYVFPKDSRSYSRPQSALLTRFRRYRAFVSKELDTPRLTRWPSLTAPVERAFRRDLVERVPDPRLREVVEPVDRFGCKRTLVSNLWYPALARDDVRIVNDSVTHLSRDAVHTRGGEHLPADVVVYGTGFQTTNFLRGVVVTGRGGRSLHDSWADGAEAYLGMAVPDFPNFFLMYGPNTNPAWNSVLFMLECQVDYLIRVVQRWVSRGPFLMEAKESALRRFDRWVQRSNSHSVWVTGCTSWFLTASGRNTQNWPALVSSYWWRTRRVRWSDFVVEERAGRPAARTHRRDSSAEQTGRVAP